MVLPDGKLVLVKGKEAFTVENGQEFEFERRRLTTALL
jgi:hypothetical protein